MKKGVVQMFLIALVGSLAGLGYNAVSPKKVPLIPAEKQTAKGFQMVGTDEVKYYTAEQGARVVDSRSREEFSLGHIPGAVCLPDDDFDATFPKLQGELAKAPYLILYCSGGSCATSEHLADKLVAKGIPAERILIYGDGFPGWMRAKNPIESDLR